MRISSRILTLVCLCILTTISSQEAGSPIRIVPLNQNEPATLLKIGIEFRKLRERASATIGTPYKWGGTDLKKGIDCSNYTWQIFRSIGKPYQRFYSTLAMARLTRFTGLTPAPIRDADIGDLLVYGYYDATNGNKWHGHVRHPD